MRCIDTRYDNQNYCLDRHLIAYQPACQNIFCRLIPFPPSLIRIVAVLLRRDDNLRKLYSSMFGHANLANGWSVLLHIPAFSSSSTSHQLHNRETQVSVSQDSTQIDTRLHQQSTMHSNPVPLAQKRKPWPSYFLVRTTGEVVPLIAVDELPPGTHLIGVPRSLDLEDTIGMLNLGLQRSSGSFYRTVSGHGVVETRIG